MHCIYPEDFPADCIADCSSQGSVDEAVEYWVSELEFTVPPQAARDCLRGYGAWEDDELADDEQNKRRILWLACGDFSEGSDIFCLE
jgi:hypothetical protein